MKRAMCVKRGAEHERFKVVLQIKNGLQKTEKREKVMVGPGPRGCNAGYETNGCGELRIRWRGLCALEEWGWACKGECCKQNLADIRHRERF